MCLICKWVVKLRLNKCKGTWKRILFVPAACGLLFFGEKSISHLFYRGWIIFLYSLLLKGMSLEEGAMKRRSRLRINISLRGLCGGLCLDNGGQMRFICYSSILKSVIVYENEYSGYENETSVIRRDQVVGKKGTREREKSCISPNPLSGDMWNSCDGESVYMEMIGTTNQATCVWKEHKWLLSRHPLVNVGVILGIIDRWVTKAEHNLVLFLFFFLLLVIFLSHSHITLLSHIQQHHASSLATTFTISSTVNVACKRSYYSSHSYTITFYFYMYCQQYCNTTICFGQFKDQRDRGCWLYWILAIYGWSGAWDMG